MMIDERPDPDRLLAEIKKEEMAAQRGKLKIFIGACAGVGKTYAMLNAAQQRESPRVYRRLYFLRG
jgi:two-component system sensor histidine kinase KdpD